MATAEASGSAAPRKDFFISYNRADQAWAEWIAWQLEDAGYTTVVQAWDFRPGGNFVLDMLRAAEAQRTIAVLSPDYLTALYTQPEWAAAFAEDPTSAQGVLLPVRVRPCDIPRLLRPIVYIDLVGLEAEAAKEQILAGLKQERAKPSRPPGFPGRGDSALTVERPDFPVPIEDSLSAALQVLERLPLQEIPDPAPVPRRSPKLPARNNLFVGREDDLRALAQALKGGHTTAVGQVAVASGLGGIGKTQLASEFVHRYGQFFRGGVFWLSFADPAVIPAEITACGGVGGLDLRPEFANLPLDDQLRLVQAAWDQPIPRLLVFDNCEDPTLLRTWRPTTGGCRVLVTSRNARWDVDLNVHQLALDTLPRDQSVKLLRAFPRVPAKDPALTAIAAELGDLPLALHLAGSYLSTYASEVSPAQYLEQLRTAPLRHASLQPSDTQATASPTEHDQHVARTFEVSFTRLDPTKPVDLTARLLLAHAACLAPGEPIPDKLLATTLRLPDADEQSKLQARDALNRLLGLGLLEPAGESSLRLHRLLAVFVLEKSKDNQARAAVEDTLAGVLGDSVDQHAPSGLLPLEAHLRYVADAAARRGDEAAAKLSTVLGIHLRQAGNLAGARQAFERALAIRERVLPPDHPDIARSLNNLANVLTEQRDLAGARERHERALAIRERVLPSDHPDIARSLNNLANVLWAQGDLAEARTLYERALAIRERVLSPDHPDTATSLNSLGMLLHTQGDFAAALPYLERALAIRERVLPPDHPDIARSLSSLTNVQRQQGDLADARERYERALAILKRALGPEHPDTLIVLYNLRSLGGDI